MKNLTLVLKEAQALSAVQSLSKIESFIVENQISSLWQSSDGEDVCTEHDRLENRFIIFVSIQKNLQYVSFCSHGKWPIDFLVSVQQ